MDCFIDIKCIYALKNTTFYFFVSLCILPLACSSYAFIQKQNIGLDVSEYPELIYEIEKIPTTRNLFVFDSAFNLSDNEISNIDDQDTYGEISCNKWIKKIKYLGTFKVKAETWVLVQNSELMIDRIKKGEYISYSELMVSDISENSFTTTKEGMSACSFQKVSY